MSETIERELRKNGVISFARFMRLALYCPVYGYYEKERDSVGRQGDFFTSVSVGGLFGELLAFQFVEWLQPEITGRERDIRIVEAGAHDGRLAKDVLAWLRERRAEAFRQIEYCIVEPSAQRRKWQQKTLAAFADRIRWMTQLSDLAKSPESPGVCGIMFSNELLDSMPVHRLGWDASRQEWFEWGVGLENGKFVWAKIGRQTSGLDHPELPEAVLKVLPDGFTTEVCPAAVEWWTDAARVLQRGKLVGIDYGLNAAEFFTPERKEGTLRAYFRHHSAGDLLANAGGQDLTAHVNFTAVQSAGETAGLKTEQFVDQTKFLTHIAEKIWKRPGEFGDWTSGYTRQFHTLTHPEHLGRSFRVLVQSR